MSDISSHLNFDHLAYRGDEESFSSTESETSSVSGDDDTPSFREREAITERPDFSISDRSGNTKKAAVAFGGRTISVVSSHSSSSVSGITSREHFYSRDEFCNSSDDSNESYTRAEKSSSKSREEIMSQGYLLSAVDFKRIANPSKILRSIHSALYHELVKSLQDYERVKNQLSPQLRLEKLELLEKKTNAYRQKKIGEQEITSSKKTNLAHWSSVKAEQRKPEKNQSCIDAADLLLEGIDREKKELTSKVDIFSIGKEHDVDEATNDYQEPLAQELKKTLEKFSPLAGTNVMARTAAREGLLRALVQGENATIPPEDLPKLIDQQDAVTIKNLTREKLETMLIKCHLDSTQRENAQARLVVLQKHIATVQRITTLNEAQKAKGITLDVGTREGFQMYLANATRAEIEALGSYRPAEHLAGAKIVSEWKPEAK